MNYKNLKEKGRFSLLIKEEMRFFVKELYPDDSKSWESESQLISQELVLEFAQLKMALKNK